MVGYGGDGDGRVVALVRFMLVVIDSMGDKLVVGGKSHCVSLDEVVIGCCSTTCVVE